MSKPTRKELKVGMLVELISGERGFIEKINGRSTDKGVKVTLEGNVVGRVAKVITKEELKRENFIFYNKLLYDKNLFSFFDNVNKKYLTVSMNGSKMAFLYQDHRAATNFLNVIKKDNNWSVRKIPKIKRVTEVFKIAGAEFLHINGNRNVSIEALEKFYEKIS